MVALEATARNETFLAGVKLKFVDTSDGRRRSRSHRDGQL